MGILVTRPAGQAQGLCDLIEAQGGHALRAPTMEIVPPRDIAPALDLIARLNQFDMLIFISINAVTHALAYITQHSEWPKNIDIAAVGKRTALELTKHGHAPNVVPNTESNSEALLATEAMRAVAGKKILIFRGEGGRELLASELRQRGAQVDYAQVYRRAKPAQGLRETLHPFTEHNIDAVVVTSNEGLQNLYDIAAEEGLLQHFLNLPLIVVSPRGSALAKELGFKKPPILAKEPSDSAIVSALSHIKST